jgi:glutamyl-tRNA reductase
MPLHVLGLNHTTAPIDLRERLTVPENQLQQALGALLEVPGVEHAVLLSTCNRTEIYAQISTSDEPLLTHWLAEYRGVARELLDHHTYQHTEMQAVQHLFRVACGLDSLILGEPQILGQVKQAWSLAHRCRAVQGQLDRLFQQTFATAKLVRTETQIGSHPVSVAYASVKLARQLFSQLDQSCVMLIGAGETVELVAQHLDNAKVKRLLIANRTLSRAQALASQHSGYALPLSDVARHLAEADIIISATASPGTVVSMADAEAALRQRKHRPMLFIDLAVPRDIDTAVSALDDVYLYTVDDLNHVLEESRSFRQQAARSAEDLIALHAEHFFAELRALDHQSGVLKLRQQVHDLRTAQLEKARQALARGEDPAAVLEILANQLSNKILHGPTAVWKQAALDGNLELLRAAEQLFQIDTDAES